MRILPHESDFSRVTGSKMKEDDKDSRIKYDAVYLEGRLQ